MKKQPLLCNDSLERSLTEAELHQKKQAITKHLASIYEILGIDWSNDHNSRETPERVAKMLCEETLIGRFSPAPKITLFDNSKAYDQLICTGPIRVRSTCAHHWQPIFGTAYIGILPKANGQVMGLSKYARVVDWFSRRFQMQEELTTQVADFLEQKLEPEALGVRIISRHFCMAHRGVEDHGSLMDTIIVRGSMRTSDSLRNEFLSSCKLMNDMSAHL